MSGTSNTADRSFLEGTCTNGDVVVSKGGIDGSADRAKIAAKEAAGRRMGGAKLADEGRADAG